MKEMINMSHYESFKFPEEYTNFTKSKLLEAFIRDNVFTWKSGAIYNKKFIEMFKGVITESDSNELTWWKFWLKALLILSQEAKLFYLQKNIEKLFENIKAVPLNQLPIRILDFNTAMLVRCRLTLFPSVGKSLVLYRDDSISPEILSIFKNEDKIEEILKNKIPESYIKKSSIKNVVGEYVYNNIPNIQWQKLMLEFIYRETLPSGTLSTQNFKNVLEFFVFSKYLTTESAIFNDVYQEIKRIMALGGNNDNGDEGPNNQN